MTYNNISDIIYYNGEYVEAILTTKNEWILLPTILIVKNKKIFIKGNDVPLNEFQIRLISAFQRKYGGCKYIDY